MATDGEGMQRVGDETLAGLAPADRQKLAPSVSVEQLFSATKPPVRRRPRRTDLVNLVVRIELAGTTPPVWRRLELASDLFLDEVHEIVQAAFGWTDSHLHRFGCGPT